MTFFERLHNAVVYFTIAAFRQFIHLPLQYGVAQKYFGHLGELPSMDDLLNNVSAILINSHHILEPPRPAMPGISLIAGAHIKKPKPLPRHLQTFLDEAKDGAIYFSFGTHIKSSQMPPEKFRMILGAFNEIKQRVLWKYENESIANIPPNVMIHKWMPQSDILAHSNVILFISHGE